MPACVRALRESVRACVAEDALSKDMPVESRGEESCIVPVPVLVFSKRGAS